MFRVPCPSSMGCPDCPAELPFNLIFTVDGSQRPVAVRVTADVDAAVEGFVRHTAAEHGPPDADAVSAWIKEQLWVRTSGARFDVGRALVALGLKAGDDDSFTLEVQA
jgi:hypothetical protein